MNSIGLLLFLCLQLGFFFFFCYLNQRRVLLCSVSICALAALPGASLLPALGPCSPASAGGGLGEGRSLADASLIWSLCSCPNRLSASDPLLTQRSEEITVWDTSGVWAEPERKVNGSGARWTPLGLPCRPHRGALAPSLVPVVLCRLC